MRTRHLNSGLLMAAAALLCLAGCKKDEEGEKIMLGTQFEKSASSQKTYLGDGNVLCWSANDSVFVNGVKYKGISSDGIAVTEDEHYYAVYPATTGNSVDANGGTVEIPAVQIYHTENGKQVIDGPMAARLDAAKGTLHFKNLYSLLKVTVSADDKDFTVNTITVTGTGSLSGSYTFTFSAATTEDTASAPTVSDITSGGSSKVTLKYIATEVSAGEDKDFYLVVHPMAAQKLTVKVNGVLDDKMVVYTYHTASARSLNRSRIGGLGINLQQLEPKMAHEWVDLGLSVLWATCNVGAEDEWESGDYFAWGETEPYYESLVWTSATSCTPTWKSGKNNGYCWQSYCGQSTFTEWTPIPYDNSTKLLNPDYDAATANWGGSWRMPTHNEWCELMDNANCKRVWQADYHGVPGWIVTSKKAGYTDKSIFIPAVSRMDGTSYMGGIVCYYWSSSLKEESGNNSAYALRAYSSSPENDYSFSRCGGFSVRPVCTRPTE